MRMVLVKYRKVVAVVDLTSRYFSNDSSWTSEERKFWDSSLSDCGTALS